MLPLIGISPLLAETPSSAVTHSVGLKTQELGTTSTCEQVKVHVRTVAGTIPRDSDEDVTITMDPRLRDLRSKLEKLPYQKYELLADRSAIVPLRKRKAIPLSQGHELTIRPLYANDKRVGVWLKWISDSGMKIIDSRLHFNCNEPMLTGIETNAEHGLILAVKVSPH